MAVAHQDRCEVEGEKNVMSENVQEGAANVLAKSYQTVIPPEPAMSWDSYAAIIGQEWQALLTNAVTGEKDFQEFFERHPSCLPQMYPVFRRGAHGPYPGAIISQPVLPGFSRKVPDFLYITRDSATVYAVLIEIEHPAKPWATSAGQQSAEFTQATNQIADWKSWFSDPLNIAQFRELYRIPSDWNRSRTFEQKYFLIYGRRTDPSLTEAFNRKRKLLERKNECHMTYDRIQPNGDLAWCLCAKLDENGYRAISIPPTMELGPMHAHFGKLIRDKDAAVRANRYLSDVRKQFLITRWPYWDEWNGGGMRHSEDRE
jgi:hypothetical protein